MKPRACVLEPTVRDEMGSSISVDRIVDDSVRAAHRQWFESTSSTWPTWRLRRHSPARARPGDFDTRSAGCTDIFPDEVSCADSATAVRNTSLTRGGSRIYMTR